MGIEDAGLGMSGDKEVTLAGQAGYVGAWDRKVTGPTQDSPEAVQSVMEQRAILEQIKGADFETLDGVFDKLSEAVINNPDIVKDPSYLAKLEAAHKRYQELKQH